MLEVEQVLEVEQELEVEQVLEVDKVLVELAELVVAAIDWQQQLEGAHHHSSGGHLP